jgi:hypothetical protein
MYWNAFAYQCTHIQIHNVQVCIYLRMYIHLLLFTIFLIHGEHSWGSFFTHRGHIPHRWGFIKFDYMRGPEHYVLPGRYWGPYVWGCKYGGGWLFWKFETVNFFMSVHIIYMHINVYIYICVSIFIYPYLYIYIYICTYIYI